MKLASLSILLTCLLSSCLPQTRTNQLLPVVRSSTRTGEAVSVNAKGGNDQSTREGIGVNSSEFEEALETSLVDSGLFQQIGSDGYQLEATILRIDNPAASVLFNVITEIEVAYTLQKGGAVVWKKTIRSSHRTETREALLGEFRDRMSTEGAVRENIKIAVSSMSEALR
jgi:hypothetical protein